MTRARELSRLGNTSVITASSTNNVGIGSTIPDTKLDVVGDAYITGVVTATTYYGSGANLTGIDATQIQTGNTSVQTFDTGSDGRVLINTEGVERARVDSSGNVGIGTDNPGRLFQVYNASSNPQVNIKAATGGVCELQFGDNADEVRGNIVYNCTDDYLSLHGYNNTERLRIDSSGHTIPGADATQNLGSPSNRWANIYSADLQLSNEGSSNDVDGTWGQYTIQEGENDLFLINRRTGKKYKFNLTEVE